MYYPDHNDFFQENLEGGREDYSQQKDKVAVGLFSFSFFFFPNLLIE